MSYGMHDYLAEKALGRNSGIRKTASSLFDKIVALSPKQQVYLANKRAQELNTFGRFNDADLEKAYKGSKRAKKDGAPATYKEFSTQPQKQVTLKDRILAQVMANKYALSGAGALGAAGAAAGAFASEENRLRNALLGGGVGAMLGGVAGHIADKYV